MPTDSSSPPEGSGDHPAVNFTELKETWEQICGELSKVIVSQDQLIEQLFISILSNGHCLVEGIPGVAKSLTARTFARVLGLEFHRIRGTPDLECNDVIEDHVVAHAAVDLEQPSHALLHANVVLVDGIDRLPPKTLSILHQAIQERSVSVSGRPRRLPDPFLLIATKYPGTEDEPEVPLEHRDDRFMFQIRVRYPSYHDEYQIAEATTAGGEPEIRQILSAAKILLLQQQVRQVEAPPHAIHYALRLVRSTRVHEGENPDFVYEWVSCGAGPRAVHYLTLAAKVRAALHGRSSIATADVRAVAHPVLRHRVITNRNAQSTGVTVDRVIDRLLHDIPDRLAGDEEPPSPGDNIDPQEWSHDNLLPW